jgi:hypothetical protein
LTPAGRNPTVKHNSNLQMATLQSSVNLTLG